MGGRRLAVILAAVGSLLCSPASGQVEGTYRFAICEEECDSTDSLGAVANGELVLFSDSSFVSALPPDLVKDMRYRSLSLRYRGTGVNACFRFSRRVSSVGGHELFAGIVKAGMTSWDLRNEEISFRLYRSPEGHFTVLGTVEGGLVQGRGVEALGGDPRPPHRGFLAEPLGPPDPTLCGRR